MTGGKVQFLSCKDEVIRLINEGYTYKQIYTIIFNNGKITISYNAFCLILKKYGIFKMPESAFASMTEDIRNEIHSKKEKYKKYGALYDDQLGDAKTTSEIYSTNENNSSSKQDDEQHTEITQKHNQISQPSQQTKPLFEIKRLGDDAFE